MTCKQAIAILVHRDVSQVNLLIKSLEGAFDIYVHVDKKSDIAEASVASLHVWKEFEVHWGGYDMVEATVFLYRKILETGKPYTHIILLSGDSLPVKSNEYIIDFLSSHPGLSFLENKAADANRLNRRRLIWYKDDLKRNYHKIKNLQTPFRVLRWIQKRLNLYRSTKGYERTGSQWTILALPHVQHMMVHCRFKNYKFMAVPDECFVQNHFTAHNLPYLENLIYAHWPSQDASFSPDYIDAATYEYLLKTPYLFARKFENTATR